jgi:hypothetical protein
MKDGDQGGILRHCDLREYWRCIWVMKMKASGTSLHKRRMGVLEDSVLFSGLNVESRLCMYLALRRV